MVVSGCGIDLLQGVWGGGGSISTAANACDIDQMDHGVNASDMYHLKLALL